MKELSPGRIKGHEEESLGVGWKKLVREKEEKKQLRGDLRELKKGRERTVLFGFSFGRKVGKLKLATWWAFKKKREEKGC